VLLFKVNNRTVNNKFKKLNLKLFLCSLFAPICLPQIEKPIHPCESLCNAVREVKIFFLIIKIISKKRVVQQEWRNMAFPGQKCLIVVNSLLIMIYVLNLPPLLHLQQMKKKKEKENIHHHYLQMLKVLIYRDSQNKTN